MTPRTFIMIGRSGCGKGTQADLLLAYLKEKTGMEGYHLETGKKFREFIKTEGYTADLAREIINTGRLQPEFLAIWNWTSSVIENLKPDMNLVIDGAPRKLFEAEVLNLALEFYKRENPVVLFLNVSENWARERLMARQRGDDKLEGINRRLAWYETEVLPVVEFFKKKKSYGFLEINGEQSIEKVQADILSGLKLK
ncbi:MAG: nucleoside monophosphate kinase [Candidatus Pacebacteria bacterium]|nr:nucleoside monophosphate kinase [Candidatus Paceibacterota bacterium]